MPVRRFEALQLAELLGSLMGSVIDAQAQSSRATVDFVEDVGFENSAQGKKLRTVSVRYNKLDENGASAMYKVDIPLLAMVNVPTFAVKEAKFSLAYDVVSASRSKRDGSANGLVRNPAQLLGFVRKKAPASKGNQTTSVNIDVVLEQQALPLGVERLFDLAELGISEQSEKDGEPS